MMINNRLFKSLVLIAAFLQAGVFAAYCDELSAGARACGMSNASAALSEDVFGYFNSPAGPALVRQGQFGLEYSKLWVGLKDDSDITQSYISVNYPIIVSRTTKMKIDDSNEVAVSSQTSYEMAVTTTVNKTQFKTIYKHLGTVSVGTKLIQLTGVYQRSAHCVNYARLFGERTALGMNIKLIGESYTMDEYMMLSPVFGYGSKTSVSAVSADVGAIYNLMPRFFAGLSVSDINQPNLALAGEDKAASTLRLGFAYRQKDLKWAADIIKQATNVYGAAGFEKWFNNQFAVRSGMCIGGKNYASASCGASLELKSIRIDYAFSMPFSSVRDTYGSHTMSFTYRFGRQSSEYIESGSLEMYYAKLQEENINLKDTLAQTEAEKRKLEEVLLEEATMRIRERIKNAKAETKDKKNYAPAPQETSQSRREIKHIVKPGDSLQTISEKYYGDSKYWSEIYQVNKDNIGRGGALKDRQVLVIPSLAGLETERKAEDAGSQGRAQIIPAPVDVRAVEVKMESVPNPAAVAAEIVPVQVITPVAVKAAGTAEPSKSLKKNEEVFKPQPSKEKKKSRSVAQKHMVVSGENLKTIAQKYYNDALKWKDIYVANKSKIVGGQITPGQELIIPPEK